MNAIYNPINRIKFWYFDNRLSSVTTEEKKYKYLEKAYQYATLLPDIRKPYNYIKANLRYVSEDENQLAEDCNKISKTLLKTIAIGIVLNLLYIGLSKLFFLNEPFNWFFDTILWVPVVSLIVLFFYLPSILISRYNATQFIKKQIDAKESELESEICVPKITKAKLNVTNEEFYCLAHHLSLIGNMPGGNKTKYSEVLIGFFSSPKSGTIEPSAKNHSRYLVEEITKAKTENILALLPKKCPKEIEELIFNGILKGKVQINIKPTVLKQFFMALNGVFYEELDESSIDKFISEAFVSSKKIKEMNISNLLDQIRYNIKYNNNKK